MTYSSLCLKLEAELILCLSTSDLYMCSYVAAIKRSLNCKNNYCLLNKKFEDWQLQSVVSCSLGIFVMFVLLPQDGKMTALALYITLHTSIPNLKEEVTDWGNKQTNKIYCGLNCVPQKKIVGTLTSCNSECDLTWRQGLSIDNYIKTM